jgi:hypothetical protein
MLERKEIAHSLPGSALVAIGALLGVETVRRHGEHLIALGADAMDYAIGAPRRCAVSIRLRRSLGRFVHD